MSDFTSGLKTVVTRKEHHCACFEIYCASGYCVYDVPAIYADHVTEAGMTNGVIPKGTECYTWSGIHSGEWFKSYAFKGMHNLICAMDWFDE
ncbi:hypothetical protein NVP1197A_50 [Vibrio phage 1.197.A._10N.286.54.F2]|nr:hypothetical protein NVP1197A_50 [Vibrio phage 1.197.A._10N.286.54.F2]